MARAGLLLFAALSLAGCATVQDRLGLGLANPPPSRPGVFDATYFGQPDTVALARGATCRDGEDRPGTIEVGDNRLSYAYAPDVAFNPAVAQDGTFADRVGATTLRGRIEGRRLRMVVASPACRTEYDFHAIGNRS